MMKTKYSLLAPKLISLGIALSGKPSKIPADIETTLVEALPVLRGDLKLLNLTLTWAWEMGDLVHVERLKSLATKLEPIDLAFLGGIAEYTKNQFRNWDLISNYAKKILGNGHKFDLPEKISFSVTTGHSKPEPAFKSFGFIIPEISLSDRKKLIPRKYLVEDNARFRFRSLFGTNWRADIAFVMSQEKDLNAFKISKLISCSYETAHRIKRSLDETQLQMNSLI